MPSDNAHTVPGVLPDGYARIAGRDKLKAEIVSNHTTAPSKDHRSKVASAFTHGVHSVPAIPASAGLQFIPADMFENDDHNDPRLGSTCTHALGSQYPYDEEPEVQLPHNLQSVSHIAVDIGGTLAKVVYFSPYRSAAGQDGQGRDRGVLRFGRFETDKIEDCIKFMRRFLADAKSDAESRVRDWVGNEPAKTYITATGGGAFKYYERIRRELGVEVLQWDEMECLIKGLDYLVASGTDEVFTYNTDIPPHSSTDPKRYVNSGPATYPYLLVNIGSGVSMVKVMSPGKYVRVGGTSLGGGTFWGLLSLLTGARTFDEMLALADDGDNRNVDMLVGDIYGTSYNKIGLDSSVIASSFGKVLKKKTEAEKRAEDGANRDPRRRSSLMQIEGAQDGAGGGDVGDGRMFKSEDIARSLLYAISNNIGQIAYLQSEKHDIEQIYFGGSFIRGHEQTLRTLSFAIKFWSKGSKQAYFLRHEGYLGAVGAFLKRDDDQPVTQ
ncbi:hypothetical protein B0A49_10091 [Cryomyces minteri]|uniref:Pantothenate kinase n=1 Tax=Cryomyces minteri TaxID=331657 RepID=A0A4U0WJ30_9PEZI|nr:hypothetical protein B0A49_10091 [Cryomyces minteri]